MAEKGQTSSMTSVTEEDISAGSESDTTESSYSNITSSLLSSTDTDDKLTPGLIKISISNTKNEAKRKIKLQKQVEHEKALTGKSDDALLNEQLLQTEVQDLVEVTREKDVSVAGTYMLAPNFVHPYGSNPLPLKYARDDKKQMWKDSCIIHPVFDNCQMQPYINQKQGRCKENLGVDDTDGKLSTDFSDTSSIQIYNNRSNNNNNEFNLDSDEDDDVESVSSVKGRQSFLPDLSSDKWYEAPCFDRYWSHYRFVMEWYHMHVQAVKVLQAQMCGAWGYPVELGHSQGPWQPHRGNSRRSQQSRKAYRRRGTKGRARHRSRKQSRPASNSTVDQDDVTHVRTVTQSPRQKKRLSHAQEDEDEEDLEMEITDEMLDFFTTSYKHKLERAKADEEGPVSLAPTERPGVRRTQEMKELYGTGAPMIQAMETAMQMSFDRFLDKFQPSLWPNMPLKINFTK